MKYLPLLILLSLALALPTVAATEDTGSIHGILKNATTNQILANHEVILEKHVEEPEPEQEPEQSVTTTDADGQFRFDALSIQNGVHYMLRVVYKEAPYTRESIHLTAQEPEQTIELNVYDTSDDISKVKVLEHQVWFARMPQFPAAGQIQEFIRINNTGNTAYMDSNGIGFRIGLPEQHQHAQSLDPGLKNILVVQGNEMLYQQPLPPGETILAISYVILAQEHAELSRPILFDTDMFWLFVSDPSLRPVDQEFQENAPRDVQGQTYLTYRADGVKQGQMLSLHLSPTSAELPVEEGGTTSGDSSVLWFATIIALAFIIIGLVLWLGKRQPSKVSSPATDSDAIQVQHLSQKELEQLRDARLELIVHLDELLEANKISEKLHAQLRDEQKEHLALILRQMEDS